MKPGFEVQILRRSRPETKVALKVPTFQERSVQGCMAIEKLRLQ
jgi:hypothetical protein